MRTTPCEDNRSTIQEFILPILLYILHATVTITHMTSAEKLSVKTHQNKNTLVLQNSKRQLCVCGAQIEMSRI